MKRSWYVVLSLLVLTSMVLAACGTTATPTPTTAAEEPTAVAATEAPTATEAAVEEATPEEAATEEAATEEAPAAEGEPMWNPQLLQAFAAAIDREELVDRVFEGRNTPAYSMVPPGYPFAVTEPFRDMYGERDLDMAIQLLTDLGYTADNPAVIDLWYPPEHYGTTTSDVMQVIKEQIEETGLIQINLHSQNWAEYVNSFVAGELPAFMLGWFPDFADPDNWLTPFGSCLQSPDNGVNFCDEEMDALLQQAAASNDDAEREALYTQIGEKWAEQVPTLPLFWEPEFITVRDGVEGCRGWRPVRVQL